jgi:signal-transduction protein with cAMP-binding, CBS, and nucleotidyltransferase domain
MKTGYKVCDAMTEEPVVVKENISLMACANIMKDHHVGAVIIKNHGLHILTEQDIVRKGTAIGLDPNRALVSEIMTVVDHTAEPQQDIFEALIKMRETNIRHLPVLNNGDMVGLLTLKDILKIEPQLFELMVEKFELKEEERKPIKSIKEDVGVCNICGQLSEDLVEKDNVKVCNKCFNE